MFRDILDIPEWRPMAITPIATVAGGCIVSDKRNNDEADPYIYQLASATVFNKYHVKNDEWLALPSPALAGTFGAGAASVFATHDGPSGVLAAGWTNIRGAITTALPAAVGVNQLANRGDNLGFFIKIIGNAAGSSGRTEIRRIVANTAGTTPTIRLDSALSFTPIAGDRFEIMSGRVYLLGAGTTAAGIWRWYDIATNSYFSLATANLPATIGTDSTLLNTSELYVPHNRFPGEGFLSGAGTYNGGTLRCLTATATTATTITGEATAGDNTVLANEYRNFQIRIVEDTAVPTAVGQRRRIISHTAGASPVYTVAAWTVTPSATARYVIENWTDNILLWTSALATTFVFNITANAWTADATVFAHRPAAVGVGVSAEQSFSIVPDADKNARHSFIYSIRGGGANAIDLFDIAGAATGVWTGLIPHGNAGAVAFTTGTSTEHATLSNQGRYFYINHNALQRFFRFDMLNRILEPFCFLRFAQGTAVVGKKMGTASSIISGTNTRGEFIYVIQSGGTTFFQCFIQR